MDLNDFKTAEKNTGVNGIPTFEPPTGNAPKIGADGKSQKVPTFTPPTTSTMEPGCYYHPEERVVGHCARCGKNLCHYCCDSFGVGAGEFAGKALCYDCTKKLVCNGVQREHNKKLNNGLPILHKVPPKRDYGRYFCIMAEKGGTSHGGLTEKLSPFFHAKKQEVNAYGR